ncbi:MAG: hypothetical protein ACRCY3_10475 [Sphingorhabdus sp.]
MNFHKISFTAVFAIVALPAFAQDEERQEIYDSFLSCAAFHTIEAARSSGNAASAQQATAVDYAQAAAAFAPDGKRETADADLKIMLAAFQEKLKTGEPRAMAEQWTGLETSCGELHPLKDDIVNSRKAGAAKTEWKSR